MVRFSDTQNAEFLIMYEQSGIRSKVRFILASIFGEKKALAMLYKLEQETIELSKIGREVLQLCEQFKQECLDK